MILVTPGDSPTARNIVRAGAARLALGGTRDVVMIDALVDPASSLEEVPAELAEIYAAQSDWDPRLDGPGFMFLVLRTHRIQAWRDVNEIASRTVMRDGIWLC